MNLVNPNVLGQAAITRLAMVLGRIITTLIDQDAKKVTAFLSPLLTVKASRRLCDGKIHRRARTIDVVVTIGKPNYQERRFIKDYQRAGEPFPVKRLQITMPPVRRHG